ncbi:NAD-dependent epimerase/dehydratase family protein [Luteimonas yindakuii]|uniref:polysaccharide biosynthesis C-terminal domain-containing protein n=1 Tax=Luteimonas yindakuii TaxID=2565782 RepID=UPI001AA05519|nr:NAD-dependent epimerase/dehydratase family protein [Luteimonas yindakuii]
MTTPINVLVTGAGGFIAKNLTVRLGEAQGEFVTHGVTRNTTGEELEGMVRRCDIVVHLAGINRPDDEREFATGNVDFTTHLLDLLETHGARPVLFSSSIQAAQDNPYGRSKLEAEVLLAEYSQRTGATTAAYRLPNVFGKWSRPDYNSAVATFCDRVARHQPITIRAASAPLHLLYIDDLVDHLIQDVRTVLAGGSPRLEVAPVYPTTVGALAAEIEGFADIHSSKDIPRTGSGLTRALYATYLTHLDPSDFAFPLTLHVDPRGAFSEMLRTADSGQFSFFTAKPGVTRGGHYHHTKNEKFLVVRGSALFRFKQIATGETYELATSDQQPLVVKTIPGWAHDITNVGNEEMIVMLWANEAFDRDRPDTFAHPL